MFWTCLIHLKFRKLSLSQANASKSHSKPLNVRTSPVDISITTFELYN